MRDILHYLWRMLPAALLALVFYAVTRPRRLERLREKKLATTLAHEVALALFFALVTGLLWLTVLPEVTWESGRILLQAEGVDGVNLRPFVIFEQSRILARQGNPTYFLINFWGNIAMFLPMGFFPALLWRKGRWWKALFYGAGLSLFIELCQLPMMRGTDIDDLWLNTLGALLGYGLAWLIGKCWPQLSQTCKVREVSPWT